MVAVALVVAHSVVEPSGLHTAVLLILFDEKVCIVDTATQHLFQQVFAQ